jgi:hypothetical protein
VKPLRLLIAVVILGGLGGAVWYSERHPPSPETKTNTASQKILTVPQDQVKRLQFTRPGGSGDEFTLEKGDDGKWKVTEPKVYKADETTLNTMLSNLTSLTADQVLSENNTDWATYGLDPPKLVVTMTLKDGKQNKVSFGLDAPASSVVYARLNQDGKLFTVPSYVKASLDERLVDVRDRHLMPFDDSKVARVVLTANGQTLEFSKAGSDWQILKPRLMRADTFSVDDMVRSAHNLIFDSVIDESGKPPAKYSFSSPYEVLEVTDASGTYALTVGREKQKDSTTYTYYAKTTAMPGVFQISSTVPDALNKNLDSLRNRKLFDFGFNDPAKVEVRDGSSQMVIEKKNGKWLRTDAGNKELPADKVQTLIDHLRNLSATSFPSDDASAQSRYGLNKPTLEAKVTSDDGKRVEHVLMAAGPESKYYAVRENEPTTYEIDKTAYEDIQKSIGALK